MDISFTLVMPAYNAEKYISDMIDSIINQTYTNWNLIIVDDGSTDCTGAICDSVKDPRIKVIHNDNQGQMLARINGIMLATGDYTLVVDADDKLDKSCLEEVNNVLNNCNYDCVMFPYMECDESLNKKGITSSIPKNSGIMYTSEVMQWVICSLNHGLVNKVIKTELIKKGAIESIHNRVRVNGDYALIIPILCNITTSFFLNKSLYYYRIYGGSVSHNISYQHIEDTDFVVHSILQVIKNHDLLDENLLKNVYLSYLNMITHMLEQLSSVRKIKINKIMFLYTKQVYINSEKYENLTNFSLRKYIELLVLRKKFFFLNSIYLFNYYLTKFARKLLRTQKIFLKSFSVFDK